MVETVKESKHLSLMFILFELSESRLIFLYCISRNFAVNEDGFFKLCADCVELHYRRVDGEGANKL